MIRTIFLCLLTFFLQITTASAENRPAAPNTDFIQLAQQINTLGDQLVSQYTPQNSMAALNGFSNLYFEHYEAKGMELAIMALSPQRNIATENLFTRLIGLAASNAPKADVQSAWEQLKIKLTDDAALLASTTAVSFSEVLIQSFMILLREGFEAMLVVTALITYLRRSGHTDKTRVIYYGIGAALVASIITAAVFTTLFHGLGASREAMEGIVMLVASGVLFYVSYWLFSKREATRWQNYIKSKMSKALSTGSLFALALAAFLAVYREGAETILFYQALASNTHQQQTALILGVLAASASLIVLFWGMQKASFRIPYTWFFTITAVFLYYMAFFFIGGAMLELQEAGWIGISPIMWMPSITWLGIYPTWQSVDAQLLFLIPSIGALVWYTYRSRLTIQHQV
jgi:high-affinity iron transporter